MSAVQAAVMDRVFLLSERSTESMTTVSPTPAEQGHTAEEPERKRLPLHTRVLIGLAVGAVAGGLANFFLLPEHLQTTLVVTDTIGRIFLRLVFMVVLPLVISALALGVLELGDLRRLGRVGARTLLFTLILSATSVAIGLALVNLIQPGARLSEERRGAAGAIRHGRRVGREEGRGGEVLGEHAAGHHSREPSARDGRRRRRQFEGERHAGRDVFRPDAGGGVGHDARADRHAGTRVGRGV